MACASLGSHYPGFTLIVEESAKRRPDEVFFRKQPKQALKHADGVAGSAAAGIVYALLVNKCSVEANARMDGVYSRMLLRWMDARSDGQADDAADRSGVGPRPDPDREIRLIPLPSYDFYEVANAILEEDSQAGLRVEGDVWRKGLEVVYRRLRGRNLADGKRWMAKTLMGVLQLNEPARARLPIDEPGS